MYSFVLIVVFTYLQAGVIVSTSSESEFLETEE
jgi:hypothetical protein